MKGILENIKNCDIDALKESIATFSEGEDIKIDLKKLNDQIIYENMGYISCFFLKLIKFHLIITDFIL